MARSQDFWVFGYGSLMWRPDFPFAERRVGTIHGYHRRFCMYSSHHRGTAGRPGLVLALAPGGSCRGIVYRVPQKHATEVSAYLFEREMPNYAYLERAVPVRTGQGTVTAHTYVADHRSDKFARGLSVEEAATIIRGAHGISGSNLEYLENTVAHLRELDLPARDFAALLRAARLSNAA